MDYISKVVNTSMNQKILALLFKIDFCMMFFKNQFERSNHLRYYFPNINYPGLDDDALIFKNCCL